MAAPQLAIEVKPQNPYGLLGGKNPFTNSETSFERTSGFNTYVLKVRNKGSAMPAGAHVTVVDTLPEGLVLAGPGETQVAVGKGWTCKHGEAIKSLTDGIYRPRVITCTLEEDETAVEPYEPIQVHAYVEAQAAASVTDKAVVESPQSSPEKEEVLQATEIVEGVPFGIDEFKIGDFATEEELKENASQKALEAGSHPFALDTELLFNFTTNFEGKLVGAGGGANEFGVGPKEVEVELPPGLVGNPRSWPQCPLATLREAENHCPHSAVGYISFNYIAGQINEHGKPEFNGVTSLIYNMVPPPGHPAAFGLVIPTTKIPLMLFPTVRSNGNYGITVGDEASGPLRNADIVFCEYGAQGEPGHQQCSTSSSSKPFLTNPVQCVTSEPPSGEVEAQGLLASIHAAPYPGSAPSGKATMQVYLNGGSGPRANLGSVTRGSPSAEKPPITGCPELTAKFDATAAGHHSTLEAKPATPAEGGASAPNQPSAVNVYVRMPEELEVQRGKPGEEETTASPALKDLTMRLPAGLALSAASAAPGSAGTEGLHTCSRGQFGAGTEAATPAKCPTSSQIGTVEVFTPLLNDGPNGEAPVTGELYVGEPECGNEAHPAPCEEAEAKEGKLIPLFLQLQDKPGAVVIKLPGIARWNPAVGPEGVWETSFDDQPELPFTELILHLRGGPRAPFATSEACGLTTTTGELTPWSSAESAQPGEVAHTTSNLYIGCPQLFPFEPRLDAGTEYPSAGNFSSFSMTVAPGAHGEEEQSIKEVELHMPPGLTAKLAGVPRCGEAKRTRGPVARAASSARRRCSSAPVAVRSSSRGRST